jgi:hypothetical protein
VTAASSSTTPAPKPEGAPLEGATIRRPGHFYELQRGEASPQRQHRVGVEELDPQADLLSTQTRRPRLPDLWVRKTRQPRCYAVFVDESAETIASANVVR